MNRSLLACSRAWMLAVATFLLAASPLAAFADPPTRAARLSFVSGSASFSPSGSDEWLQARINRPLWVGDRLWSGDGRLELQLGGASLRLAPQTLLQILNFDDRIAQFEVTQGSVTLHVRAIDRDDVVEIDTPYFAFVTREEGDYRVDVERDHTAVSTRRGNADIYGQDVAYRIDRRERFAFYSADLRDYDAGPLPPSDGFDRWSRERSQREDRSASSRYVSPELVGFADLDNYGEWRTEPTLGNVWIPRVAADWAPYRYGHWSWVDPWGWTWIDDAPWGFAPSHYGRWTQIGRSWAWVPGPRDARPAYSPAMVAWVGGDNFSLTVSSGRTRGVGWFPLAPGEVWRPSYEVSRDYFTRVNVSNTVVNNTTIVNVYENRNEARISNADYRFRATRAAVTAVPVETFVQGRPVQLTQAQLNANAAAQANVLPSAPARPVRQSIVGPAPRAQAKPPAEIVQRPVVARTAPPAVMPSIEQRTALVREGKPVTREALDRGGAQPAPAPAPQAPGKAPNAQPAPERPATAQTPQRSNVRVVDADKAAPKPLPESAPRNARGEEDRARGKGSQASRGEQASPKARDEAGTPNAQAGRPASDPAGQSAPPSRQATPSAGPPERQQPGRTPEGRPPTASSPQSGSPQPPAAAPAPPPANVQPGRDGRASQPARESPQLQRAPVAPAPEAAASPSAKPAPPAPRGGAPETPARATPEGPGRGPVAAPPASPAGREARPPSPESPSPVPRAGPPASTPSGAREAPRAPAETPAANRAAKPEGPSERAPAASTPPAAPPGRGDADRGRADKPSEQSRAQPAKGNAPAAPPARTEAAPAPRPAAAAPAPARTPDAADRPPRGNQPRAERGNDKEKDDGRDEKEKGKGKGKD